MALRNEFVKELKNELKTELKTMPMNDRLHGLSSEIIPYLIIWKKEEENKLGAFKSSESHKYFDYSSEQAGEIADRILLEMQDSDRHVICNAVKKEILNVFSREEFSSLQGDITNLKRLLLVMLIPWILNPFFQKACKDNFFTQPIFSTLANAKPYHIKLCVEKIGENFFLNNEVYRIRNCLNNFFNLSFYAIEKIEQNEILKNWIFNNNCDYRALEEYFQLFQENSPNHFLKNWIFDQNQELTLDIQVKRFFELACSYYQYRTFGILLKNRIPQRDLFNDLVKIGFDYHHVDALEDPKVKDVIEKFLSDNEDQFVKRLQVFFSLSDFQLLILKNLTFNQVSENFLNDFVKIGFGGYHVIALKNSQVRDLIKFFENEEESLFIERLQIFSSLSGFHLDAFTSLIFMFERLIFNHGSHPTESQLTSYNEYLEIFSKLSLSDAHQKILRASTNEEQFVKCLRVFSSLSNAHLLILKNLTFNQVSNNFLNAFVKINFGYYHIAALKNPQLRNLINFFANEEESFFIEWLQIFSSLSSLHLLILGTLTLNQVSKHFINDFVKIDFGYRHRVALKNSKVRDLLKFFANEKESLFIERMQIFSSLSTFHLDVFTSLIFIFERLIFNQGSHPTEGQLISYNEYLNVFSKVSNANLMTLQAPIIIKIILNHYSTETIYQFFKFLERLIFQSQSSDSKLVNNHNIYSLDRIIEIISLIDHEKYPFENGSSLQNYKHILQDTSGLFDDYMKIMAFFLLYQKKEFSSSLFKLVKPDALRKRLHKALHCGGYSFLNEGDESVSLGVEVEFLGIPKSYQEFLENSMNAIQEGWHHPGDRSINISENKNTYGGESTTPPISNNKMLHDAMYNVSFLYAMGAQANPSCGLHVHLGVKNLTIPKDIDKGDVQDTVKQEENKKAYELVFMKQFSLIYQREKNKFNI